MADSLREVIARLKAQKDQNSPQSKPVEAVKPTPKPETEDMEEELGEDEEMPETEKKTPVMPSKPELEASTKQELTREQQILMEIEMLQNDGRYRAELLHQMQEINRALVVIAGVLVDLAGNGKAK